MTSGPKQDRAGTLLVAALTVQLLTMPTAWAGQAMAPVTNSVQAAQRTELVKAPPSLAGLDWLFGRWTCVDRTLRFPAEDGDYYAFLKELEFDAEAGIRVSRDFRGGFNLSPNCVFVAGARGPVYTERHVDIEFYGTNFCFGMPYPDVLLLRKEPVADPSWFVLEHSTKHDLLLFRKVGTEPTNSPALLPPGKDVPSPFREPLGSAPGPAGQPNQTPAPRNVKP